MAVTIARVWTERNRIVYLCTADSTGGSANITSTGGATPDLVTDGAINTDGGAVSAALRRVCRAGLDGLGSVAAAGFDQAKSRNLFLGNGTSSIGNGKTTPTAQLRLVPNSGAGGDWRVDANVSAGVPIITVTAAGAVSVAYLYVELNHTLAK